MIELPGFALGEVFAEAFGADLSAAGLPVVFGSGFGEVLAAGFGADFVDDFGTGLAAAFTGLFAFAGAGFGFAARDLDLGLLMSSLQIVF